MNERLTYEDLETYRKRLLSAASEDAAVEILERLYRTGKRHGRDQVRDLLHKVDREESEKPAIWCPITHPLR